MRLACSGLVLAGWLAATPAASAQRNDLTLERLIGPPATLGAFNDPTGNLPLQSSYRSLMSELSVALAPQLGAPADSLGWSGFNLAFTTQHTSIANQADYWRQGVRDVSSSFLSTVGVMARKGIFAFFPSIELGAGLAYLVDSSVLALQAYAKVGLHEGFHNWPLPSIALRGAVSRPMGLSQVDMTITSADLSLSKSFGVRGAVRLDPYLGANLLVTVVKSLIIDTTPFIDAHKQGPMGVDLNSNTTFPDQDPILRWRLFTGLRLVYSLLSVTAEVAYTFCNDTAMDCRRADPSRVQDRSDGQTQLTLSAGIIF